MREEYGSGGMFIVNDIFYSLQGEGVNTGLPFIFVRFSGCNKPDACRGFCDTRHETAKWVLSLEELLDRIRDAGPSKNVLLTGGEPMMQITERLLFELRRDRYFVAIETNGSLPFPTPECRLYVDWLTVSPKSDIDTLAIKKGDELKVIFPECMGFYDRSRFYGESVAFKHYLVQPCHCKEPAYSMYVDEAVQFVKENPRWRLSIQAHKYIKIP